MNRLNPFDFKEQKQVFECGALSVAALLNHEFENERWQYSRELDPIVGVSFTGLFDFFVHLFGRDWLEWWETGRDNEFDKPITDRDKTISFGLDINCNRNIKKEITDLAWECQAKPTKAIFFRVVERAYLAYWKDIVFAKLKAYCKEHSLKVPNRGTTVQPSGSKSLLSNASPGWHPPKATRYIRRVTFRKDDPVALTHKDMGFNIVPSQSDKDENGNLLNDPYDPRCTEWLVEIPVEVFWADIAEGIDISKFSALSQFDFYMQVQKHYTSHNTSSTIELRHNEIEELAKAIYDSIQNDEGYISVALLARFDANETFPRLPFEPISKEKYQELSKDVVLRRKKIDFVDTLNHHATGKIIEVAPSGCDSDACTLPEKRQ